MTRAELGVALLSAAALVAVHFALHAPAGHRVAPYLCAHLALLGASALAWRAVSRSSDARAALRRLLLVGLALRAALIPASPFTTTDVGRYLWDGAVALAGLDPYALTPLAPELAALRQRVPLPLDHHDVATCYPPLALGLFAVAALAGARALLVWKALCALASCLTAWVVARWSLRVGAPARAAVVVFAPILVLEAGVGAHLDTFVALAAALMLDGISRARWDRAALAAGSLVALKIVPGVVALPVLLRAPRPLRFALVATLPVSLSFGAAELLGLSAPGSLPAVAENWSFGAPLWAALYARYPLHDELIRPALAALGVTSIALISLRRRSIESNVVAALGVTLTVSPVLYPWYGAGLAAALPFAPRAWAALSLAALPLSYEVLDAFHSRGVWAPARWPMLALTLCALAGLAGDLARSRRAR